MADVSPRTARLMIMALAPALTLVLTPQFVIVHVARTGRLPRSQQAVNVCEGFTQRHSGLRKTMDEDLLFALDYNYLDASRIFTAYSATGEYLERTGLAIASCGLPVRDFNWGFLKPPYEDLDGTAEAVRSYFTGRRLPFRLTARGLDNRWLQRLESSG